MSIYASVETSQSPGDLITKIGSIGGSKLKQLTNKTDTLRNTGYENLTVKEVSKFFQQTYGSFKKIFKHSKSRKLVLNLFKKLDNLLESTTDNIVTNLNELIEEYRTIAEKNITNSKALFGPNAARYMKEIKQKISEFKKITSFTAPHENNQMNTASADIDEENNNQDFVGGEEYVRTQAKVVIHELDQCLGQIPSALESNLNASQPKDTLSTRLKTNICSIFDVLLTVLLKHGINNGKQNASDFFTNNGERKNKYETKLVGNLAKVLETLCDALVWCDPVLNEHTDKKDITLAVYLIYLAYLKMNSKLIELIEEDSSSDCVLLEDVVFDTEDRLAVAKKSGLRRLVQSGSQSGKIDHVMRQLDLA